MKTPRRSPRKKEAREKFKGTASQRTFLSVLGPYTPDAPVLTGYECLPSTYIKRAYGYPESAEDLITRGYYAGMIDMPSGSRKHDRKWNRPRIYELTPDAERLLAAGHAYDADVAAGRFRGSLTKWLTEQTTAIKVPHWRQSDHFEHKFHRSIDRFSFDIAPQEHEGLILYRTSMRSFMVGNYEVKPDIPVFGYRLGKRTCNLIVERDRGTETRDPETLTSKKKTIRKMVEAYAAFFDDGGYADYKDDQGNELENAALAIICSDIYDEREPVAPGTAMRTAMEMVRKYVAPELWDQYLFCTETDFTSPDPIPPPTGRMVTRNWLRVNGSELNIMDYLERRMPWTSSASSSSSKSETTSIKKLETA